jgi:hypothetical protein
MANDGGQVEAGGRGVTMNAVRYGLPALVVLGGLVVMSLGSENDLEGGAMILSAGMAIFFINWLFRVGVAGERDRDAEQSARDYLEIHGRWPDESAPPEGARRRDPRPLGVSGANRAPVRRRSRQHR